MAAFSVSLWLFVQLVIWCFLRDEHVMHVTLTKRGVGDLDEPGFLLQFLDRVHTAIAHSRAQSTHQLSHHGRDRAFVGYSSLNALRNELTGQFLILPIPVAAAFLHSAE